jgi:small subunit ribosomal protein S4e
MSKHLKRLAAPRAWKIHKKLSTWVPKPNAGAHAADKSVPVGILLRDYLSVVDSMGEAKRVVGNREILVDGRVATSHKTPVGLMDVVSIPKMEKNYRVVLDHHGRVTLSEIPAAQAGWKFCRVENKTVVSGGRVQLNLHDGRNVLVKETNYKTGDVVKMALPEQKILAHYAFGKGMTAFITGGAHVGEFAKVEDVETIRSPRPNLVNLKSGEQPFSTVKPYVFLVGKDKPEISLPEVNA